MARTLGMWTAVVAIVPLVACNQLDLVMGGGPERALSSYLDATISGDVAEAYGYISAADRSARSLAEYRQRRGGNNLAQALASKVSYEVIEVSEHGDTATAIVEMTTPDLGSLFSDAIGGAFASSLGGEPQEKIQEKLVAKYSSGDLPTATKQEQFTLVNDPDGWRVFLDWATKDKVQALLSEASDLKGQKKLHAALERYDQVLELDSEIVEAAREREELQGQIRGFEEKQAYIGKVELRNFKVGKGQRFGIGDAEPAVFGTVANNGDRTLKEVELTVYFLDTNGTVVGEEDYHPVLVTKYSFGGDNKPLKPNYVKDFGYTVKDKAPSNWAGKVRAKITDIEFAEG